MPGIPNFLNLEEIQRAFRDVWSVLRPFSETRDIDWVGRRLSNIGDATAPKDAITKSQVDALIATLRGEIGIEADRPAGPTAGTGRVRIGLYASRGPAASHQGEWFIASDLSYAAWISIGSVWKFVAGIHHGILSAKPTLGTEDGGFILRSTDFNRDYRWSGSAWADAPGADARGQVVFYPVSIHADFGPPSGWVICDGTAGVNRSTPTATITTFTTPDLVSTERMILSTSGSTGGTGGNAKTHTHQVTVINATTGGPNGTTDVQSGAGANVASNSHGHSNNTFQTVTSAGPSGTGGDDAMPPYMKMRPFIRV